MADQLKKKPFIFYFIIFGRHYPGSYASKSDFVVDVFFRTGVAGYSITPVQIPDERIPVLPCGRFYPPWN